MKTTLIILLTITVLLTISLCEANSKKLNSFHPKSLALSGDGDEEPNVSCETLQCATDDQSEDCVCTVNAHGESINGQVTQEGGCLLERAGRTAVFENAGDNTCNVMAVHCTVNVSLSDCNVTIGSGPDAPENPDDVPEENPDDVPGEEANAKKFHSFNLKSLALSGDGDEEPSESCETLQCEPDDQSEDCVCTINANGSGLSGQVTQGGGCLVNANGNTGVANNAENDTCEVLQEHCSVQHTVYDCNVTIGENVPDVVEKKLYDVPGENPDPDQNCETPKQCDQPEDCVCTATNLDNDEVCTGVYTQNEGCMCVQHGVTAVVERKQDGGEHSCVVLLDNCQHEVPIQCEVNAGGGEGPPPADEDLNNSDCCGDNDDGPASLWMQLKKWL